MRAELKAYNALIAKTFIDIGTAPAPVLSIDRDGETVVQRIDGPSPITRRIFSRKSWDLHGRFYGGWWQRFNSDYRSTILLDDQPTVEVDFKGLHIAFLSAEKGTDLDGDPYAISASSFNDIDPRVVRRMTKRLVLIALNAKSKSSACRSFRDTASKNLERRATNQELDDLLDAFVAKNPAMKDSLFSDQGIRLMNLDGKITSHILNHFTRKGIPVLSVHDSYIIDCRKVGELRQAMAEASKEVVGRPLPTAVSFPGIPEYTDLTDAQIAVLIENKSKPRKDPYVQRLLDFEARNGRIISPYDRDLEGYLEDDYLEPDEVIDWE